MLTFLRHFERYPASRARLFIASKAGVNALNHAFEGNKIIDLLARLKGRVQFNVSLSIFPGDSRGYIEPLAESMESRLKAAVLCRQKGIILDSALVQPILLEVLREDVLERFLENLKEHGIINIKPEFLTVNVENMVMLCQVLRIYDKDILKKVFESYFSDSNLNHVKQRGRTAPDRLASRHWFDVIRNKALTYGISTSVCFWVRRELEIGEEEVPFINENGYKCLGYQSGLFSNYKNFH